MTKENILQDTTILNKSLECLWGIQDWKRLSNNRPKAKIPRPEGFMVIEPRPLDIAGDSLLYFVKKINTTTHNAAECLKSITKARKISYSGLKDKNAIAFQYMTIEHAETSPRIIEEPKCGIKAWLVKRNTRELQPGEHYWNFFRIQLILKKPVEPNETTWIVEKPFPNYYGPQRFGTCKPDTHISGLLLLRGYQELARYLQRGEREEVLNEKHGIPPNITRLLVQAYQSYLFNKTLSRLVTEYYNDIEDIMKSKEITRRQVRLYCPSKMISVPAGILPEPKLLWNSSRETLWIRILKEVIAEEGAETYVKQFPRYKLRGGIRPLLSYPCSLKMQVQKSNVVLRFILPRGSYATVFLREYFDLDWINECKRFWFLGLAARVHE